MSLLLRLIRLIFTLAVLAVAGFLVVQLWYVYMLSPWTRDGRVLAQTVTVAPEVSGTVTSVPLTDNELVQKGAVLFQLDQVRFRIALALAQSQLDTADLQLKLRQADVARRKGLSGLISQEETQTVSVSAEVAGAGLGGAQASVDLAKLNLARSTLYAPTTGYVTHLRLQPGDYADAGTPVVAIIDASSFWVVGYFEETKLAHVHLGDQARIRLMGFPTPLLGHVTSIGRGIADPNDAVNTRGLPTVSPVFEWVRLAQRIPVNFHIDSVPPSVLLAAGMTASIDVGPDTSRQSGLAGKVQRWIEDNL
jgi:multidrug resistance efflux pump